MYVNQVRQEIVFKIVYYGPGFCGKTTNLQYVYDNLEPSLRSNLITLNTKDERTLFFDFMQLELGRIRGKKPRFNLYTVPGQVEYSLGRKIILHGVDGLVFVADSQQERMSDNLDNLLDLELRLVADGRSLDRVPWVIQYNKRDLSDIQSVDKMQEKLNFLNVPFFEAIAINGIGVFETLKTAIQLVISSASDPNQTLK
jgi:signal recognition particle receptor subunit beta